MKKILLFVFGLLLCWNPLLAQNLDERCTQNGESACIDWDRGVVIAEGLGAPAKFADNAALRNASAQRAARLGAARNILEMIKGVNLSSETTVQDAMVANDTIRTSIQGHLHGLRPVGQPRYFSDGTIKVRLEARLQRTIPDELIFLQQALPESGLVQANSAPVELLPVPQNSTGAPASSSNVDANQVYTGVIVDARNTDVQPAMSPKIFDEAGNEIYGSAYVDHEFVVKHGMAGYLKDLDLAQQNDRVQGNPLVIQALGSTGKNQTDIVISNENGNALRQMAATQSFLREARVVVLLN